MGPEQVTTLQQAGRQAEIQYGDVTYNPELT